MTAERPHKHATGIYFGLDEDAYHADPALGSTDIRRVARNPSSYWFESWMNPNRKPDKDTPSRARGRAMHKLLYEGEALFDRLYMCGPRHDPEATPAEKGAATKAANNKAALSGHTLLSADDYDQVVMASAMITKNPKLQNVFTGGFSEVSIFWERGGVPVKARIDYLKQRGCGDLKGCANQHDKFFPQACRDAIANYRYDVQAALYLEARALVPLMVKGGHVNGINSDDDAELLEKIATAKAFGWQWVFYQTEGAPITWSPILSPKNPMLEVARGVVDKGMAAYTENMTKFGESMWLLIEDPQELYLEDMPGWFAR